jgi:hypothetical protein
MVDICKLCSSIEFCQHHKAKEKSICKFFIPKYNCNACSIQCTDDVLCYKFTAKDSVLESDESHPIEAILWNLLSELMKIEKSTDSAIAKFKQKLEANGIRAIFGDRQFRIYINNLLALYALDKLIQSYGLEEFRVHILSNEIDRIFKPLSDIQPETRKVL